MSDLLDLGKLSLADWATIATALLAAVASGAAWFARPQRLLVRRRNRALHSLGIPLWQSARRTRSLMSGHPNNAAEELNWLARALPSTKFGFDSSHPVTFALDPESLTPLSRAYQSYAANLRRGSFLGSDALPIIEEHADVALEVAAQLSDAAKGVEQDINPLEISLPGRSTTLTLLQFPHPARGILAYDVAVSYSRHRTAPDPGDATRAADVSDAGLEVDLIECSTAERARLKAAFDRTNVFDGVLPRLVDWRPERDSSSGRHRLHLSLAETTYAAVLLDHYSSPPEASEKRCALGSEAVKVGRGVGDVDREVLGKRAQLLTLSLAILTSDGMFLFAGRSANAGSHRLKYGPAVNGNLEFEMRKGIVPDADGNGIPSPIRALVREAREELGVVLEEDDIHTLGLGAFSVPEEHGTSVLLTVAYSPHTADQIVSGSIRADPMEGRWEIGTSMLAVPMPTKSTLEAFLYWLLHDSSLTPHATLVGIAVAAHYFELDPAMVQRVAHKRWNRQYPVRIIPVIARTK